MAQRSTEIDTPGERRDRPVLAPDTWLVGQLQESALEAPPWAVERRGRGYVEMSELSFRIAEQATGEQSIDEIATAVSTVLRRPVSAVDVAALVHTVLVPRGVVRSADGSDDAERALDEVTDKPEPGTPAAPVSPAAMRGRRGPFRVARAAPQPPRERIVGPARLEALASVLMWLFWPPVVLTVTALALAASFWLVGVRGLAGSVMHALAVPILLPVALLLTGLGAAVQGLGPMVALYSGGATIQRVRIAPSLLRPGFVVDVTDDYGLSRHARLMVNVSGVYLQLVVVLLLCTIGWAAGAEFLFLPAVLLALNILRLLLPFGRPGADRLLADWLLVQTPLRYPSQAFERFLPGSPGPARPLPPLKTWGRAVIWGYLAAVAIVLAVVGLAMLRVTPTLLATFWYALTVYLTGMFEALGARDAIGFLSSTFNAAILALTTFCLAVAIVVGVRMLLARAWSWSRETPRRRLLAGIGFGLLALLVAISWVPVRGWGGGGSPRSLVGIPFRSLSDQSRGTIFDLFGSDAVVESVSQVSATPHGQQ